MPMVDADWTFDRQTGNLRYIGEDHSGGALVVSSALITGTWYEVDVVGDADFTTVGAAFNLVGELFEATGTTGTTGQALQRASYATTIEAHRWIGGLSDDATSSGDDEHDMTDVKASSRATDNQITLLGLTNIDDAASEHIYDGSILQGSGGSEVFYDGIVNFGNNGVAIQLQQNGGVVADDWWNYGLGGTHLTGASVAVLNDTSATFVVNAFIGYVIRNVTDGSQGLITENTATTVTGVLFGGTDNDWDVSDIYQISRGLNEDAAQGISHRFMVKVRAAGADIDGLRVLGTNRTYGKVYGEFFINGTARGNNVLALKDANDLNNSTARATIDAFTDVHIDRTDSTSNAVGANASGQAVLNVDDGTDFTDGQFIMSDAAAGGSQVYKIISIATDALTLDRNLIEDISATENIFILNIGFVQIDVDNDTTVEDYYAEWDLGAQSKNGFFESLKHFSADATDHFIYGISGELFRGITHEFDVDTDTGTFDDVESVSWSTGTGQMLAIDGVTGGTKMWIQLLTGVIPGNGDTITGGNSGATVDINVTVTDRVPLIKTPFNGASTGTAIVGAYGLTLQFDDLGSSDLVFDLTNEPITPPNTVTFDVTGGNTTEDTILAGPNFGDLDVNGDPSFYQEWTLNGALSANPEATIVINETPDAITPAAGWIMVIDDNNVQKNIKYSSFTGSTFTVDDVGSGTDDDFSGVGAADGNRAYQSQLHLNGALSSANETTFTMENNIPSDTPASGQIRVQDASGRLRKISYDSFTGAVFTSSEGSGEEDFDVTGANDGASVFVAYLDESYTADPTSFNYVYAGVDRIHTFRVRDGGASPIVEFIQAGTMGTNGGSLGIVRQSDA